MSEHLVVIRSYRDLLDADEAQAELSAAGVYSLLVSEDTPAQAAPFSFQVALAVNGRDAELALHLLADSPTSESAGGLQFGE